MPTDTGPGRDALARAKWFVPPGRPGHVSRRRLLDLIDRLLADGSVLVSAPAGFGKSCLLAEWARARGDGRVAWLSLDQADNDPVRFWRHLMAAVSAIDADLADRVGPIPAPTPGSAATFAQQLLDAFGTAADARLVVVLDDYHVLDAGLAASSVVAVVDRHPAGPRFILSTRSDPVLPLGQLRVRGALGEVRVADLRFTAAEADELLAGTVGTTTSLSGSAVEILTSRTEGWAAGLHLAALSLRGRDDADDFVSTFSGTHRFILDFLSEEVLDRQPDAVRSFLIETSILARLSDGLCDAVTGRRDSQHLLEQIERDNLFVVPLDDTRSWWRYHHLFAELLRGRLFRERPERVTLLHARASEWFEAANSPDDAIGHAVAAGDPERAADLVERHVDALLATSQGTTMARWFESLPHDVVSSRPRLLLAMARVALLGHRGDAAERAVDAAAEALAAGAVANEPFSPSVGRSASLIANVPASMLLNRAILAELRGDARGALGHARDALAATWADETVLAAIIEVHQGIAQWLLGDVDAAAAALGSAFDTYRAIGQPALAAWAAYHLGMVYMAAGRLEAARRIYDTTIEISSRPRRPPLPAVGVGYVGLASVAYELGDIDTANRWAAAAITQNRALAVTAPLATALSIQAWCHHATGDDVAARASMREAGLVESGSTVVDLLNPVPTERARLQLAMGDLPSVGLWLTDRDLDPNRPLTHIDEPAYLVLARWSVASGSPAAAIDVLDKLYDLARDQHRVRSVLEIGAIRAEALVVAGQPGAAQHAVAEIEPVAARSGLVRAIAAARHTLDDLVTRPGSQPLVDPLTARELEVLGMLADGRSNRDIAADLFISLDTVKKHVTHILDKLGASNRTEAASVARRLGLLV